MKWEDLRDELMSDLDARIKTDKEWRQKLVDCKSESDFANISLHMLQVLGQRIGP